MGFWGKIIQSIQEFLQKLTAVQKQRLILVCTAVFALLLTLSVIISITGKDSTAEQTEPERTMINLPIPAGELFIPEEPDFLPQVLLQRERRTSWTDEDAAEHWQDPLKSGEEQWREKIEAEIDKFLERVP
ncbi:MAG: hypothetical protein FWD26_00315 [Treponema sp.]|nr:hypothetical protein [Treponema sp.]